MARTGDPPPSPFEPRLCYPIKTVEKASFVRDKAGPQRPKSGNCVAGNPRRNALFDIVPETRGLRRLDGGVRSHTRTGLSQPTPVIPCYLHFFRDKDPCLLL